MKHTMFSATVLSVLLALGSPAAVQAQPAGLQAEHPRDLAHSWRGGEPGMMMGWGRDHGMMGDWDDREGRMMGRYGFGPGMMMGGPAQFMDGRLAFLRVELKITEDQQPLFDAYAKALRATASGMQSMHERMRARDIPESLPERLQWRIDAMTSRLEAMKTVQAAAVPLYEALSEEQKTLADELIGPMGMM